MEQILPARQPPVHLVLGEDTGPDIVLASATVDDSLLVLRRVPDERVVPAGVPLEAKLVLRIEEISRHRDRWSFLLELWLDGQPVAPEFVRWQDRWGLFDDRNGVLARRLPPLAPGRHELAFRIRADHERGEWGGAVPQMVDSREIEGTVTLYA